MPAQGLGHRWADAIPDELVFVLVQLEPCRESLEGLGLLDGQIPDGLAIVEVGRPDGCYDFGGLFDIPTMAGRMCRFRVVIRPDDPGRFPVRITGERERTGDPMPFFISECLGHSARVPELAAVIS